jgi:hypothetical protein
MIVLRLNVIKIFCLIRTCFESFAESPSPTDVPCQAIEGFADGAGDGDAFVGFSPGLMAAIWSSVFISYFSLSAHKDTKITQDCKIANCVGFSTGKE